MSYQAARVPAWKRLGLKLKGSASGESPAPASSANTTTTTSAPAHQAAPSATNGIKRKEPPYTHSRPVPTQATNKRQRTDEVKPSPRKSVKFTEDTKVESATDKIAEEKKSKTSKKPKQKKAKSIVEKPATEPFNLEPSLAYLRQWHSDRDSWKFNKNHQTLLIKYFFDIGRIPAADVSLFYLYIRDLKGFVRTRLREQAAEIKKKDMEDGAGGFAEVKEKEEREAKQQQYDEVLAKLLKLGQEDDADTAKANGKRSFDEVEFTAREMDDQIKQRVIKRMRAELVLDELSEDEETATSTSTTANSTTAAPSEPEETKPAAPAQAQPVKQNDDSQPKPKRRRLRNTRTADISDSSSSESDSDSSDSDSDSSDDEENAEMPEANADDTSSSSSSSSSDSDTSSDDEVNGEGSGSDSDSEDE
ncbi:hypothetical protein DL546_004743 [Coniochaeta pulveracea]|uniref:WKF domain-containing protein n=1 Tax=Coniochaeta pulveracea TaxID=177199 RepID=A0A420YFN0_9PEZI|nr:hypothetical protein DL546_004743 [Coniochaeta pulveracea]